MATSHRRTGEMEKAAARRERVMDMRAQGYTQSTIAEALGVSQVTVHNDLKHALAALAEREHDRAGYYRTEELAKLERLEQAVLPAALAGDAPSTDRALRIMERRSRLLGLDAPRQVDIDGHIDVDVKLSELSDDELAALAAGTTIRAISPAASEGTGRVGAEAPHPAETLAS